MNIIYHLYTTRCCPYGSSQANTDQIYYSFRLICHFLHIPRECKKSCFHFFKCLYQRCENKDKLGTHSSSGAFCTYRHLHKRTIYYFFCNFGPVIKVFILVSPFFCILWFFFLNIKTIFLSSSYLKCLTEESTRCYLKC